MFTGFATENSPALQVWDYSQSTAATAIRVALTDDCAPVQMFKTGSSTTAINVNLPSFAAEGKRITIVNACYGAASTQSLNIYAADYYSSGQSSSPIHILGPGASIDLIYSKSFSSNASSSGSGWVSLSVGAVGANNFWNVVVGGNDNSANTSNGGAASVFGGKSNTATNGVATIVGGTNNSVGATYGIVLGGQYHVGSGAWGAIAGGNNNTTNAYNTSVLGGAYGITRGIVGNTVLPACANPISGGNGFSQTALLVLGRATTDATVTTLTSNSTTTAGTGNQVILPNNSAYYFRASVIANVTAAGNTKAWTFEGAIKRGANAASTVIVGSVIKNIVASDAGASAWDVSITADTTNGGLAVAVTGAAATTIRWVCKIETTEVTY